MIFKEIKKKLISTFISIIILFLIFYSGPAEAYLLRVVSLNNQIAIGEFAIFQTSIIIEESESLKIDEILFELNGPKKFNCKIKPDGSVISGCDEIKIQRTSSSIFYGYGYGQGNLKYKIIFDSKNAIPGRYRPIAEFLIDGKTIKKLGKSIIINNPVKKLGCSLRAKNSNIIVENLNFSINELNLYVPFGNSNSGQGYIIGQNGIKRFNYKFKIHNITKNDENYVIISSKGSYKIGIDSEKEINSTITYDYKKREIKIENLNFSVIYDSNKILKFC